LLVNVEAVSLHTAQRCVLLLNIITSFRNISVVTTHVYMKFAVHSY